LRVLVACECSGVVRRAFRALGHNAWSCDLLPAEDGSPHHIQGDAIKAAYAQPWDLLIAHPKGGDGTKIAARFTRAAVPKAIAKPPVRQPR
jgi:hypothetical protein